MCRMTDAALDIPAHLFTAIDHVGIAVPDLDAAIAFYRDTYGMQVLHEETNEEQGVREAMVGVGDSGPCIQLLAPLDDQSTIAKFLDRTGPGMQQLAYRVSDVEEVARSCATAASACCTTPRGGAPPTAGSTSCTPRTPAASSSSSSSRRRTAHTDLPRRARRATTAHAHPPVVTHG